MSTVMIGDQEFNVTKLDARKVATISKLIGNLIIRGRTTLNKLKAATEVNLVIGILAALEEDDLIQLSSVIAGCDPEYARENFDLVWVTEALNLQAQETDFRKIVENFTSLVSQIQ